MSIDLSELDQDTVIQVSALVRTPIEPERVLGENEATYDIIFSIRDEYKVELKIVALLTKRAYEYVETTIHNREDVFLNDIVQELSGAVVVERTPYIRLVGKGEGYRD